MSSQGKLDRASAPAVVIADDARVPIVGIGASAGGLEAIEQVLGGVPVDSGMAFVIVQHLDPNRTGMLPEILQRSTPMEVRQAGNRVKVQPNCVYVIPPNKDLSISNGTLHLLDPEGAHGLRLPIDSFICSLATDQQEKAIGIVLSGMGSDGTRGLRAIRDHGGLTLVQQPDTAKFDSMPRSAIDADLADIVAAPAEMAALIIARLRHPAHKEDVDDLREPEDDQHGSAFEKICVLLQARTGHDFSLYKKSTIYRRIERRIGVHRLNGIANYVKFLQANPQEIDLLFKELLIGVTSFFRDPAAWAYLQDTVLSELIRSNTANTRLRAWVAGCSSGEEAYTLAMLFQETVDQIKPGHRIDLQIFATDLDSDAIVKARQGFYPESISAVVAPERLKRFFVKEEGGFRVGQQIRQMIVFAPHNLIMDPPFTRLDILTCRNLLIYLGPELQKKLLPIFHYSLKPGGTLFLGSAESIGNFGKLFFPLDVRARVFRRNQAVLQPFDLDFPTRYSIGSLYTPPFQRPDMPLANLQNLADQLLLQKFSPAAVLTNAEGDILFINGRTGRYLEPAAGKANWNIHAMVREGLRQELSLALPKALRTGDTVVVHNLAIEGNGKADEVDLTVYPISEPAMLQGMVMVVFSDVPAIKRQPGKRSSKQENDERVIDLERALQNAREEVQKTRERMAAAHEELRSANEEFQSTNEELQSTNEELTTSKEEMQSMNEELQTINAELQSKLDELSATSNDMKNLLNSTDIATVFLDNDMHVRRFTHQAGTIFKLIPNDVGRSLGDIVNDLDYADLLDDIGEVLRTLAISEKQIRGSGGRWYSVKIMPYRTLENVIDGVVITLIEISKAKHLEAELRAIQTESMGTSVTKTAG